MLKKIICLFCITCLCFVMLVGCKSNDKEVAKDNSTTPTATPTDVPTSDATSTPVPEPTATKSQGELLAEQYTGFVETPMDLGGRTIRFVTTMAKRYIYSENKDETPNETLEIIKALETIEQDYNCTIEVEQLKGRDMVEALLTAKAAGDTYGDILEFGVSDTYLEDIYAGNLVMPLEDEAIADIIGLDTNPWLAASDFGKMFGHHYGVHFKTNNSGDLLKGVVLF
ncbi:MAG: hypothetical protein GX288_03105, partial [Clostridiales bacterium]|nr:hypothetical protein [Clostridiales bacterium]